MSDTPRTDKAWSDALSQINTAERGHDPHHAALANLAAQLERELADVMAQRNGLMESLEWMATAKADSPEALVEKLLTKADRAIAAARVKGESDA